MFLLGVFRRGMIKERSSMVTGVGRKARLYSLSIVAILVGWVNSISVHVTTIKLSPSKPRAGLD